MPTMKVVEGGELFAQQQQASGGKPSRPLRPSEPETARPAKPTDDELGDRLLARWNGSYANLYGAWHRYEEGVWRQDERVALQFWNVLIDAKPLGIKPNAGKATSVEKYCQLKAMVHEEDLSEATNFINLRNGLYNLETGEIEEHRRDLYLTSQLDFAYDAFEECPQWEAFLRAVLRYEDGTPDYELISLVQEAFGYSLTADTSFRVSFWCVGASGTGKSTLINILTALAGDSHVSIDLDGLKDNQYQLADIAGKRVVTFSEPDSRQPLADGWYKKLVSKDSISARQIHGKPFNFVPVCKVWGSMNDTPRVVDRSDAVFGRVLIIPMNFVIPYHERDFQLEEKLREERAGIFNWALEGLWRLREQGQFTRARQSEAAREAYRLENDAEALFVSERCIIASDQRTANDTLYQSYRTWCADNGYIPKQKVRVGKDWKRLGFRQGRTKKERFWDGIGLVNDMFQKK